MSKKLSNQDDEWGNIELPGFGDDKLLSPNLNRRLANMTKANDKNILDQIAAKTTEAWQDPDHRAKMVEIHNNRSAEWSGNIAKANQWENKSEDAKRNVLASREKLKTDAKFQQTVKERTATEAWQKANKEASLKKWKDPMNRPTCGYCSKVLTANTFNRHLKTCLFTKGKVVTYIGTDPQYIYSTEESLRDAGFDTERIKQIINTNKTHAGFLFKNE
jgi:hypothetical protein